MKISIQTGYGDTLREVAQIRITKRGRRCTVNVVAPPVQLEDVAVVTFTR